VGALSAQVPIARSAAHPQWVGEQASRFQHAGLRLRNVVRGSEGCDLRSPGGVKSSNCSDAWSTLPYRQPAPLNCAN
jgi:hypothetical protein